MAVNRFVRVLAGVVLGGAALVMVGSAPAGAATGTSWSIDPSANPAGANFLGGVSCTSPSTCMAVGDTVNGSISQTLAEAWNGTSWSVVPTLNRSVQNSFGGVSCTGPTACTAVGSSSNGNQNSIQTLIETWNGSAWTIVPSPNPQGASASSLSSVSCTSAAFCTAVGSTSGSGGVNTLVESWNGTAWALVPSPSVNSANNQLLGVSCSGPQACIAVGSTYSFPTGTRTLVESWNGSSWTVAASPNPSGSQISQLEGVSCTGPTACTAVGHTNTGQSSLTLVESWDGSTWTIVPSPNQPGVGSPPTFASELTGVSCTGPTACTAVGESYESPATQNLVETWNGATWTIVPSPSTSATQFNSLYGVSCTGPEGCVATGYYFKAGTDLTTVRTLALSTNLPGYQEVASDGGLFSYGASFLGSMGGQPLNAPIVGMSVSSATGGYWEVAADGGIFGFNAPFFGSMGGQHLNSPIVGIAADTATGGYWEVAADGGIFGFNAPFLGSMGGQHLNAPVVGISANPDGSGYREVASDGGLFSFGAPFYGSMGGQHLNSPIVGIATDTATGGYWEVAADGGIFGFNAPFSGSMGGQHLNAPVVGISMDTATGGYREVASDGGIFSFNARFLGSMGGSALNKPIVGIG